MELDPGEAAEDESPQWTASGEGGEEAPESFIF